MPEKTENFVTEDNDDILSFGEEFEKDFNLIEEGDYEVTLENLEKRSSSKGGKYLNLTFGIRKDVDQKFKGRKLFYPVFENEGDKAYNFDVINKIIITQKGTKNYRTHFQTIDQVFQYLVGLHLVVSVEIAFDDYNGKDRNRIKDWSFAPSVWDAKKESIQEAPVEEVAPKTAPKVAPKAPEHVPSVQAQAPANDLDTVDLPDDDFPF